MKLQRGFTLIEVLVVLAIVSVLAAAAWPSYAGYIVRVKRTEGQTALIDAMQQQQRYRMLHNTYLAYSSATASEELHDMRWWSGPTAASSAYELDAQACEGQDIAECVELRAHPGTGKVDARFRDPACGALLLDSVGRQRAEGAGRCWP